MSTALASEKMFVLGLTAMYEGEFSLDWIEELSGLKASVILTILEEATQEALLVRKQPAVYQFTNPGRRQEFIDYLAEGDKERFHRNIAAILMRELPDDDAKSLCIARHLLQIPNSFKEYQWIMRAGQVYAGMLRAEKAIFCFTHILRQLSEKADEEADLLFINATIRLSNVIAGRINSNVIFGYLNDAKVRAVRSHNRPSEILLELHIAKYERLTIDFNEALSRYENAMAMAKTVVDPVLSAVTPIFQVYFLFWQGRFKDVIDVYEKFVPEVDRHPVGHFPHIAAMMVGHCYAMVGQLPQGMGVLDAIRSHCLKRHDFYLSSHAGAAMAMAILSPNHIEDTLHYLKPALKEAKTSNNAWVKYLGTVVMALAYHLHGDDKSAMKALGKLQANFAKAERNLIFKYFSLKISWRMHRGDMPSLHFFSFENEIEAALAVRSIFLNGVANRYKALDAIANGLPNKEITQLFRLSIKQLTESGNLAEMALSYFDLARHYLSIGKPHMARMVIQKASTAISFLPPDMIPDDLRSLYDSQNKKEKVLDEIYSLSADMISNQRNNKILHKIVSAANRLIGAERGALFLVNEGRQQPDIILTASKNLTREQIHDPAFEPSKRIVEEVIATRKGRISTTRRSANESPAANYETGSIICIPLMIRKKAIGALYHENRLIGNIFQEAHFKPLGYFAAQAAINLDLEEARKKVFRLEQMEAQHEVTVEIDSQRPDAFNGIIGKSREIKQVLDQIAQVSKTDATILLLGETGVGKNLVAEMIHRQSSRSEGPFITVQSNALTETLITSELFGHEKGAFTGATSRQIGRLELANAGTLFLDEIGDLPLEVQARLLRVLQSKEFERVGGGQNTLFSDFRLITATNRNLEEDVRKKRFREDLFYRINVVPVRIPPLRERKEDIPCLATHFLKRYGAELGIDIKHIPNETMDVLMRHHWPGNIRELENVIQRSLIAGRGHRFQLPILEMEQHTGGPRNNGPMTLKEREKEQILGALKASRWKICGPSGAAEFLDINPSTLRSRMKKLNINKPTHHPGVMA